MKKIHRKLFLSFILFTIFLGMTHCFQNNEVVDASTSYKYLIKVNKQQNCITIYEKDEKGKYTIPTKAMVCSTGTNTPLGTYNTMVKYRWKILLDNVWGQYSTRITGSILFHSVWYYKQDPSTLSAVQYNKLGTTCSHGCIRLTVEDAKWIYDNCPVGTTVVIYNDKNPGPLGKPKAQKLAAGTGWDPTDPDPKNPLKGKETKEQEKATENKKAKEEKGPTISGAVNKTIDWGSDFDIRKNVTAKSAKGTNLTKKIKVKGTVNSKVAGEYKITYTVTDDKGKTASVTVKIKVKKCPYKVELKGVTDHVISVNQVVDRDYVLENVSASFGQEDLNKSKIKTSITKAVEGYKVTYKATSSTGDTAKKTAYYYIDEEAPVIKAEHTLYDDKCEVNRDFVMQFVTVTDNYSDMTEDKIQVSIKEVYDKGHLVTYMATDDAGNTSSVTIQLTRCDSVEIHGVKNHVVGKETKITKEFVMDGVTGVNAGKNATDQIEVTISEPKNNVYTVTYYLENEWKVSMKIIAFFTVEEE